MGVTRKRSLTTVLICMMIFSVVMMGCSSNNNASNTNTPGTNTISNDTPSTDTPSTDTNTEEKLEPITISVYNGAPGQTAPESNKIYKKIKDELGVTLEMEFLVGDNEQKLGVMIAGGEYPDLITADTKLVGAGAVIPLEDLLEEHAPKLLEHYKPYLKRMKDSSDGHIYWLPNYGVYTGAFNETWYGGPAFWIQKAVLKEFGYPKVKTLDEYFALIQQYQEKYPEIDGQPTIGFSTLAFDWRTFGLKNAPQHLAGYPNDGGVTVDNNVAKIFADKQIAKDYYKKLNDINALGLMDKEAFAQNYDQYLAKVASGRILGMFDQHWNFQSAEDSLTTQKKDDRTYVGIPLVYDDSITDWYRDRPPINLNNGYGISVNAKDPVRIIKFLEAMMDEEWQKTLQWGIEGDDYLVDAEGMFYRTQEMRDQQVDPAWKLANRAQYLLEYIPKIQGSFSDGNANTPGSQLKEFTDGLKPLDKEILDAYGHGMWTDFFSAPPENPIHYAAWQIDLIEGSEASVADTKINDLSLKHLPKAILSKPDEFDKVWNEYVEELGKANIEAYEARVNEQIQWRVENWSE
ncbi:ABC transporter substrate-binding protein [Paenibacillus crassostreae]|uniref:Sugar ABC transporter substrate-binding protein n=1 Tax=Paenibacillus crassostreae TaxID=1763538 RepID=A0A167GM34_9BACL|nr:ABC transporter substrate-binding protein [Paenibacillus crassostreae]AOZ92241.1 sugar ABC transporter substrate-binding protein [Paenibacillus crassostreae]OAB77704.1 sugar ABC transporter substrate-binding protein [Paenibacillus crassostreae]